MIGVEDLRQILRATLLTGRIAGEAPLSLLLLASVGMGKTSLLLPFSQVDGILWATDITPFALYKRHRLDIARGRIRHIVLGDLLTGLNKPRDISSAFITFLNALVEEGIVRIESKEWNLVLPTPVKVGLVTSISRQDYARRLDARGHDRWAACGFLSRMLIISWCYSQATANAILASILQREYLQAQPEHLPMPPDTQVNFPEDLASLLLPMADRTKDSEDPLGARRLKQLQRLAMGFALLHKRQEVAPADIAEVLRLELFIGDACRVEL